MAAGRPTSWIYRLRMEGKAGALTVPPEVASQIPAGSHFQLTVMPGGLFYKPITTEAVTQEPVVLEWLDKEDS